LERWNVGTLERSQVGRLSPPPPAFKGGQNMWTNAMFEALGWAFWPSPPAPLPKWERGDSGARVWHPIAVHSYYEHLFGPPLNPPARGQARGDRRWQVVPAPACTGAGSRGSALAGWNVRRLTGRVVVSSCRRRVVVASSSRRVVASSCRRVIVSSHRLNDRTGS
jgi:hypothetical protein